LQIVHQVDESTHENKNYQSCNPSFKKSYAQSIPSCTASDFSVIASMQGVGEHQLGEIMLIQAPPPTPTLTRQGQFLNSKILDSFEPLFYAENKQTSKVRISGDNLFNSLFPLIDLQNSAPMQISWTNQQPTLQSKEDSIDKSKASGHHFKQSVSMPCFTSNRPVSIPCLPTLASVLERIRMEQVRGV
jgi:hypothetical protein